MTSKDPFNGDCDSFEVTSPIEIVQLQNEIITRTGVEAVMICLTYDGPDAVISTEHPGTLFVAPKSLDGRTVRGAIETHVPAPAVPQVLPVPATPEVVITPDLAPIIEKLSAGKTLTTAEISLLLTALVGVQKV
jgi:hypothetical protein